MTESIQTTEETEKSTEFISDSVLYFGFVKFSVTAASFKRAAAAFRVSGMTQVPAEEDQLMMGFDPPLLRDFPFQLGFHFQ